MGKKKEKDQITDEILNNMEIKRLQKNRNNFKYQEQ